MNAAHFLYKQITALPEKERNEFAMLWEESKKQHTTPSGREKRIPVPPQEWWDKEVEKILDNRKKKTV